MLLPLCGQPYAVPDGHLDKLLHRHIDVPSNGFGEVLLHSLHQQSKPLDHGNNLRGKGGEGGGGRGRGGEEEEGGGGRRRRMGAAAHSMYTLT